MRRYFLIFSALLFINSTLLADLSGYLTKENQEILKIEKEINKKSATNLKLDWINPVVVSYSYSKSDQIGKLATSRFFRISFDQPIFKSGGIYFAIKYSDANRVFKEISQEMREADLIGALYETILNLKMVDANLKKAKFSLDNAKIDVERKREQFDSGLLDSSFLNIAILNKREIEHQILTLESSKFKLLNGFKNISNHSYKDVKLPTLTAVTEGEFIEKSLNISSYKSLKNQAKELKNMTISNYLPAISLYGDYSYKDDEIQFFKQAKEYKSYGVRVSMPLFAINRGRDIEIRKLEYLKSKIALKEKQKELIYQFKSIEHTILMLRKKVELAESDIELYGSLIESAKDGVEAGEKTIFDLNTLKNSKEIAKIDKIIYQIEIEMELLKLYREMSDAI